MWYRGCKKNPQTFSFVHNNTYILPIVVGRAHINLNNLAFHLTPPFLKNFQTQLHSDYVPSFAITFNANLSKNLLELCNIYIIIY